MTDDQQAPATADGAGRLSAQMEASLRLQLAPGVEPWISPDEARAMLVEIDTLRAALATAERERDAFRHAAERNLERLSALEEIDKEHADCQASIRVLIEHRDKVIRDLAAERERNAPLRAQIKAAQDRADQAKSQIHALNRIIEQASVWVLGNRTDEHVASVNSIIEHVAKYGIDPERINQFRLSIHERFKIGLLIEQLTASESRARALREALEALVPFAEEHVGLSYRNADVLTVMDGPVLKNARAVLAAAGDGRSAEPAAPTCKWCLAAVPSWGDVCASCEANMRAHSDLANSNGPGAAPSGEGDRCQCRLVAGQRVRVRSVLPFVRLSSDVGVTLRDEHDDYWIVRLDAPWSYTDAGGVEHTLTDIRIMCCNLEPAPTTPAQGSDQEGA
jgi:hypothetical protein